MRALAVAAGGAAGSLLRWGIGLLVAPVAGGLPVATLVANVAAGLLVGLFGGLVPALALPEEVRLLLCVGLCGGLSTFSTFSSETVALVQSAGPLPALANVIVNVATCLVAVWAGGRIAGMVA